jgi:hypothetical protein
MPSLLKLKYTLGSAVGFYIMKLLALRLVVSSAGGGAKPTIPFRYMKYQSTSPEVIEQKDKLSAHKASTSVEPRHILSYICSPENSKVVSGSKMQTPVSTALVDTV